MIDKMLKIAGKDASNLVRGVSVTDSGYINTSQKSFGSNIYAESINLIPVDGITTGRISANHGYVTVAIRGDTHSDTDAQFLSVEAVLYNKGGSLAVGRIDSAPAFVIKSGTVRTHFYFTFHCFSEEVDISIKNSKGQDIPAEYISVYSSSISGLDLFKDVAPDDFVSTSVIIPAGGVKELETGFTRGYSNALLRGDFRTNLSEIRLAKKSVLADGRVVSYQDLNVDVNAYPIGSNGFRHLLGTWFKNVEGMQNILVISNDSEDDVHLEIVNISITAAPPAHNNIKNEQSHITRKASDFIAGASKYIGLNTALFGNPLRAIPLGGAGAIVYLENNTDDDELTAQLTFYESDHVSDASDFIVQSPPINLPMGAKLLITKDGEPLLDSPFRHMAVRIVSESADPAVGDVVLKVFKGGE